MGGCRNGTVFFGVDGLVAVAVGLVGFAFHVMRKGEMPVFFQVGWRVPLNESFAFFVGLHDGARTISHFHGAAEFHFLSGPNEAPPVVGIGRVGTDELDFAVVGKETGGDDLGVVEDEEVVGRKKVGEVRKVVMRDQAGCPIG